MGEFEDARPLVLVMDVLAEEVNLQIEIDDKRLQFHSGAGIVLVVAEHGGPPMLVRIGIMRAVHRYHEP